MSLIWSQRSWSQSTTLTPSRLRITRKIAIPTSHAKTFVRRCLRDGGGETLAVAAVLTGTRTVTHVAVER